MNPSSIQFLGEAQTNTYGTTATLPYASTAGSLLIITCASDAGTGNTITDNAGNQWILAGDTFALGATAERIGQLYYCLNAQPITSVSFSRSGNTNWVVKISEWSGVKNFRISNTTHQAGPAITYSQPGDLVYGVVFRYDANSLTLPVPSGYAALTPSTKQTNITASVYKIADNLGQSAPDWATSTSGLITAIFSPQYGLSDMENFPDTNMSGWNAGRWIINGGAASIQSHKGYLASPSTANSPAKAFLYGMAPSPDTDVTITWQMAQSSVVQTVTFAINADNMTPNFVNGVPAGLPATGYSIQIKYAPSGTNTTTVNLWRAVQSSQLDTLTFSNTGLVGTTQYKIRMQKLSTVFRFKIWAASQAEPSSWYDNYDYLDTMTPAIPSGKIYMSVLNDTTSDPRTIVVSSIVNNIPNVVVKNTFEGGTNTTAVTSLNSGGVSGSAISSITQDSGVAINYSAVAAHGTMAVGMTYPATSAAGYVGWSVPGSGRTVVRFYVLVPNTLSATQQVGTFRYASGDLLFLNLTSTGQFQLNNATNTAIAGSLSPNALPTNEWIRIEVAHTKGTSTSNGVAEYSYYKGDAKTPLYSWSSTTENTGLNDVSEFRLGRSVALTSTFSIYYDDLALTRSSSGYIGAVNTVPEYLRNTFESGTNSSNISVANTGGLSGNAISARASNSGTTLTFTNTVTHSSNYSLRASYAANAAGYAVWNVATANRLAFRSYVYLSGSDMTWTTLAELRAASGARMLQLSTNAGGTLSVYGNPVSIYASDSTVFPTNTWVRLEYAITPGTTNSNGIIEVRWFVGESTVPSWTYSNTTADVTVESIGSLRLGSSALPASVRDVYYDDFVAQELSSGFIGPLAAVPVASFSAATLGGSAPLVVGFSDTSTNNPTTWSWDFGDGTSSVARNPIHTYSSAGVYSVTLTVTNSLGTDTHKESDYITVSGPFIFSWDLASGDDLPTVSIAAVGASAATTIAGSPGWLREKRIGVAENAPGAAQTSTADLDLTGSTRFAYPGVPAATGTASNPGQYVATDVKPGGSSQSAWWLFNLDFGTSSPTIELRINSATTNIYLQIRVNGRRISQSSPSFSVTNGTGYGIKLSFTTAKYRRITVHGLNGMVGRWGGLAVEAGYSVLKPVTSSPKTIAIIGDVYVNGSGSANGGARSTESFAWKLATLLGASTIIQAGIGGTGWLATIGSDSASTFSGRVSAVMAMNPDMIITAGGRNESTSTDLQTAVESYIDTVGTSIPHYIVRTSATSSTGINGAIQAGAASRNIPFINLDIDSYPKISDNISLTLDAHEQFASDVYTAMSTFMPTIPIKNEMWLEGNKVIEVWLNGQLIYVTGTSGA